MTPLLEAAAVSVDRGRRRVLHDVDLTVHDGDVVALLGPNGAGKSTLLETLGGLRRPVAGRLTRHGRTATALQSPDLARRSAGANVELALAWWGVARGERPALARKALRAFNIEHLEDRPAASLSGGERRRVHLARAIALRPDVLLLDEPFAGLDPATRAGLLMDASSALRTSTRAVVVVVHDRTEAWALASRLVIVLDGRIAADGPPQELLESPPTIEVARFLGFTGELRDGDGVLLTRPPHIRLGGGRFTATVARRTPAEDGVVLHLQGDAGRTETIVPYPGPELGSTVRFDVVGGVRFEDARLSG